MAFSEDAILGVDGGPSRKVGTKIRPRYVMFGVEAVKASGMFSNYKLQAFSGWVFTQVVLLLFLCVALRIELTALCMPHTLPLYQAGSPRCRLFKVISGAPLTGIVFKPERSGWMF